MRAVGWRMRIRHRTGFSYAGAVGSSYNEARMSPRNEPRQLVLAAKVEVSPAAGTYRYEDYWGTIVTSFDVHTPHDTLEVTATSTVETLPAADQPDAAGELSWIELAAPPVTDRWHELLLPSTRTALDEELAALAASIRSAEPTPQAAALAICMFVHDEITYQPGATEVATDAVHAWRQRAGVCQDLSHLAVGLLRATGVPARYVSGYLHPAPEAEIGEPVVGQSHAWVEWWSGRWIGWDPTNGIPAGRRHVVVGRGRDYGDVPPLKGVFAGPPQAGQTVAVELTRLR
jgi:transglutaminase-like putative cysteine protease